MARPLSRGLKYTNLDVTFFQDRKVRRLQRRCGESAPLVYIALLCSIYTEGYYIKWDDDVALDIADALKMDENEVQRVIEGCLEVGLLSQEMFDKHHILTSHGIQKQYQTISEQCKRKTCVNEYSLLVSSEETQDNPVNEGVSSEEMPQRKVKKSKEYSSSPLPSSTSDEGLSEKEQEQEDIVYFFTFQKNWAAPNKEYEELMAYNSGPQFKRKWDELTEPEKKAILAKWHQEPQRPKRFDDKFLHTWQKVYEALMPVVPHEVRMGLLDDGVGYYAKERVFYLKVPRSVQPYLEDNLDRFKRWLLPFFQSMGCNQMRYSMY